MLQEDGCVCGEGVGGISWHWRILIIFWKQLKRVQDFHYGHETHKYLDFPLLCKVDLCFCAQVRVCSGKHVGNRCWENWYSVRPKMDSTSKVCSDKINPNFSTTYFLFLLVLRGASRVRLFTNQLKFKNKKNSEVVLMTSFYHYPHSQSCR